jgi:ABC-type bacteriocin/lantibiotic exporter with double-glycine peptidase domain
MVAAFHAVPPALIRRHLMGSDEFSLYGMSAAQMIQQAQQVGLTGQVQQLTLSQLARLTLPVILWWCQSHFVVLIRSCTRSRQAEILDPARGRLLLSWSQLQLCYSGVSILLAPTLTAPPSTQF